MTRKQYLALYYGIDEKLPNYIFYKKIEYINNLAKEELKKWQ